MRLRNQTLTGVDIGTHKTCALIAEVNPETGNPLIKGYGFVETRGLKRGAVVNIEKLSQTISQAVNAAETMAGTSVSSCYVSISGDHIRSMNTQGMIAISRDTRGGIGEAREIEQEDIDRVIEHTRAIPLPVDRQILHVMPQEFTVDEQSGIKNPINLLGRRLEAKVHITTYSTTVASNLTRCFKNIDLTIRNFILQSLASSVSVLTLAEKEAGSILIDIGSGTTDVIVYADDGIHHTGVVNFGDQLVTSDIAYLLRIPHENAENIKKNHGYCFTKNVDREAIIKIESIGNRPARELPLLKLAEYIEPRMEEILREAFMEAKKADVPFTSIQSVVITGGGALIKGCEELAESIFHMPARIGFPTNYSGCEEELNHPGYAAAIGMLQFALQEKLNNRIKPAGSESWLSRIWDWLKNLTESIM
ncbi:MAG TPA: cell division protein FtsA [Candidatus Marinimicrobia bacterium]|nr:cell division protein FtsA [Candidatus Neomarinimicrobiota bacterium]